MYENYQQIVSAVADTVVRAGSSFSEDKMQAYRRAIESETDLKSRWVLEQILENAIVAQQNRSPLCDDTGIPHLFLEIGENKSLTGNLITAIHEGVAEGLRQLPGRPMAVRGDDAQRIDQSLGLYDDPGEVLPAPLLVKYINEDILRLHVLLQGGGPAIRAKTYRVFHHHKLDTVIETIVEWAAEAVLQLGCSPCTLAIGIGRSHYEAAALMTEAQVYGNFNVQNDLEKRITDSVNLSSTGPLGLGGKTSVLAAFLKVGPQRASGVRIVCLRPCCCFEPRIAGVLL